MATPPHRQCSICLEDFKKPKFLDCHHTFCLECLRGLENKTPGFITCPLCQREIQLPSGGVDKLTTNFYIQDAPLVEGSEPVQRRTESEQAVAMSQQQCRSLTKRGKKELNKYMLIPMVYSNSSKACDVNTQSVGGIVFDFYLYQNRFEILTLEISLPYNFIHSCDIDYDIIFINQKDAECSTRSTGTGYLQSKQGYPYEYKKVKVDLIRCRDAFDDKNGFKTFVNGFETIFQLSVGITASNIKKVNFSL